MPSMSRKMTIGSVVGDAATRSDILPGSIPRRESWNVLTLSCPHIHRRPLADRDQGSVVTGRREPPTGGSGPLSVEEEGRTWGSRIGRCWGRSLRLRWRRACSSGRLAAQADDDLAPGHHRLEPEHARRGRCGRRSGRRSPTSTWRWSTARCTTRWSRSPAATSRTSAQLEADPTASKVAAAATAAHGVLAGPVPGPGRRPRRPSSRPRSRRSRTVRPRTPGSRSARLRRPRCWPRAKATVAAADYPLTYGDGPGEYRPTPPNFAEFPAAWVADVKPFLAESAEYYRTEGPYALDSAEYAADFDEVKTLGAARGLHPHARAGCAGRVLGQPDRPVVAGRAGAATEQGLDISDAARLFAIANLAAADASIGAWTDKYHWMFWRPITAIQEAGPDGNDATEADPDWVRSWTA